MKKIKKTAFYTFLILFSLTSTTVFAHQPVREELNLTQKKGSVLELENATEVKDPLVASLAIYGALEQPDEIDLYKFTAGADGSIPVEVLVPVKSSNQNFYPAFAFIKESESKNESEPFPFIMPQGYNGTLVTAPPEREIFFEPFSLEKLYNGGEQIVDLEEGKQYWVAVFNSVGYTGDYTLSMGTAEDFSDMSFGKVLKEIFIIKMGIPGKTLIPWLDIVGLFLFLAGFIIGLGAVTVIDFHGLLARKSKYWTEATTRTHKVTKPLIWAGIALALVGGIIYYRLSGLSSTATFHLLLLVMLVINGLFLSFRVSPYLLAREKQKKSSTLLPKKWQLKITISFVVSFLGWWSALFLLVWHVLLVR